MHDPRASTSQPPERGSLPIRTAGNVTFHPCSKEGGCTFKTGSQGGWQATRMSRFRSPAGISALSPDTNSNRVVRRAKVERHNLSVQVSSFYQSAAVEGPVVGKR